MRAIISVLVLVRGLRVFSRSIVLPRQYELLGNTSALPAGWSGGPSFCMADNDNFVGPSFTDPVGLTIESCVDFCEASGQRTAGLIGTRCLCTAIFKPDNSGFESDSGECQEAGFDVSCPGNPLESCGLPDGTPSLINYFFKTGTPIDCTSLSWEGGAALTAGHWRFAYFYNDTSTARALAVNAGNLSPPVTPDKVTSGTCTTACGNAGFNLAGVEFGNECFCGDALEHGSRTITNCALLFESFDGATPSQQRLMPCAGNAAEFCGGPGVIALYTLPGTGIVPLLPFDPSLDGFCSSTDCFVNV